MVRVCVKSGTHDQIPECPFCGNTSVFCNTAAAPVPSRAGARSSNEMRLSPSVAIRILVGIRGTEGCRAPNTGT